MSHHHHPHHTQASPLVDIPTYSHGGNVVTIKKQVPKINRIEKVVEVEEIVSKPVPNYIDDIVEVEQIVEKPVIKKVQQFKELVSYQPIEVIREEEVVQIEKRVQTVDVPVYEEEKRVVEERSEVPFTLDRHIESVVVRPFENKVVQFEEKVPRTVLVDRYEERVEREDVPVIIKRIREEGTEQVHHEVREKAFEVTLHSEVVEEVPVDVPEPVAHHVEVEKFFEVDQFVEEVKIRERQVDRPVEVLEEVVHPKDFVVTLHGESHKTVETEIPIHVKIFEETVKPIERVVPRFAPVDVAVPTFHHQDVDIEHQAVHTENYRHVHHDQELPYHQYRVENRAETIDIGVNVVKVKEVPMVVEEERPKEYIIEQIREVPERVEKEVTVVLERRIEQPVLNKKFEDEIVEKPVELIREVVEEEIVEVEEEDTVNKHVKLKTLNGVVQVNKREKPLLLKRSKRHGVLSAKQRRAFEAASRRLADLTFEKEKLEYMISHGERGNDLSELNHDHREIAARANEARNHARDLKTRTAELERHIEGLNHQIKTAGPKHHTKEHYDEGPLHRINDDIRKVREHNAKLRDFLAGRHAPVNRAPVHAAPVHHHRHEPVVVREEPVVVRRSPARHYEPVVVREEPVYRSPARVVEPVHHHRHHEPVVVREEPVVVRRSPVRAEPVHHHHHRTSSPVYTPATIREGPIRSSGVHHHGAHDLMTHSHLAESNAPRGSRVLYASPSHHYDN